MDFEDRIKRIMEDVEDEENIDIDEFEADIYGDDSDDENDEDVSKSRDEFLKSLDDEDEALVSTFGIPAARRGKTLDDMKRVRVYGPPLKRQTGGSISVADSSLKFDEGGEKWVHADIRDQISPDEYKAELQLTAGDLRSTFQTKGYNLSNDQLKRAAIKYLGYFPVDGDGNKTDEDKAVAYAKSGTKFHGGKVTKNIFDKFPDSVKQKYQAFDSEGNPVDSDDPEVERFEKQRADIDKEFIVGELDESKWFFDDVVSALVPYAKRIANMITLGGKHPTYSFDDAFTDAISSIRTAWLNDLGESPFHNYAYETMLASLKDSASKTKIVSGDKKTYKGGRNWAGTTKLDGGRMVSADAPAGSDEGAGSIGSFIPSTDLVSTSEQALLSRSSKAREMIFNLIKIPQIGLSAREMQILLLSFGLSPSKPGEEAKYRDLNSGETKEGPVPLTVIAKQSGVSLPAISKVRKSALDKLREFMNEVGVESMEDAFEKFNLEEAKIIVSCIMESMNEIIRLEIDNYKKERIIESNYNIDGLNKKLVAKYDNETKSINSIHDDSGNIISVSRSISEDIKIKAKILSSNKYFTEMASNIVSMQCAPILGVIDNHAKSHLADVDVENLDEIDDDTLYENIGGSLELQKCADGGCTRRELINNLVRIPEVGLSKREIYIVLLSFGISPSNSDQAMYRDPKDGEIKGGPVPLTAIAKKSGVSLPAISKVRKNALDKLREFMRESGIKSIEDAFNLEEAKQIINKSNNLFDNIVSYLHGRNNGYNTHVLVKEGCPLCYVRATGPTKKSIKMFESISSKNVRVRKSFDGLSIFEVF